MELLELVKKIATCDSMGEDPQKTDIDSLQDYKIYRLNHALNKLWARSTGFQQHLQIAAVIIDVPSTVNTSNLDVSLLDRVGTLLRDVILWAKNGLM